jgi:hypothetical protein
MKKTFFCCFFALCYVFALAQVSLPKVEKWGEISQEDLKMTVYPEDSNATSVVLQDLGSIKLKNDGADWVIEFSRHRRIKILDVSALDKGNLSVGYRGAELQNIEIQMFLPSGKLQKVEPDNNYTEKSQKKKVNTKVFIPNVQKGCVVEYRYRIKEKFSHSLHPWSFQEDIPVRWSQVDLSIPTRFNFVYLLNSVHGFDLEKHDQTQELGFDGARLTSSLAIFGMGHLSAMKLDLYSRLQVKDYRARIGFQLKTITYSDGTQNRYMTTWPDLAKKMEDPTDPNAYWSSFGEQYLNFRKFRRIWKVFSPELKPTDKPEDILEKNLHFVSIHVKWNYRHQIWTSDDLNAVFRKKTGNIADINLMVVALLRKAGLKAFPMLISTRGHGHTFPAYPYLDQFNSVIAYVRMGSSAFPVDATVPFLATGELNDALCNENGWVVDPENSQWVDIPDPVFGKTWLGNFELLETGEMKGGVDVQFSDHYASQMRSRLNAQPKLDHFKSDFAHVFHDITMDSITVRDQENLAKPVSFHVKYAVRGAAMATNGFIYVNPVLDLIMSDNPLKDLRRTYPLDWRYATKDSYMLTIRIPSGYKVEELPAPVRLSLPNNGGILEYSCARQSEREIRTELKFEMKQVKFMPAEYSGLRQFLETLVTKTKEQIVLKKI